MREEEGLHAVCASIFGVGFGTTGGTWATSLAPRHRNNATPLACGRVRNNVPLTFHSPSHPFVTRHTIPSRFAFQPPSQDKKTAQSAYNTNQPTNPIITPISKTHARTPSQSHDTGPRQKAQYSIPYFPLSAPIKKSHQPNTSVPRSEGMQVRTWNKWHVRRTGVWSTYRLVTTPAFCIPS
jgi:hypothetical protein